MVQALERRQRARLLRQGLAVKCLRFPPAVLCSTQLAHPRIAEGTLRGDFDQSAEVGLHARSVILVESSGRTKQISMWCSWGNLLELLADGFKPVPITAFGGVDSKSAPGFGKIWT